MQGNANTFWRLITTNKIIIPKIQRDYAQGRKDDSTTQIRESLINAIYDSIANREDIILNFIYGEVKNDVFKPIDGQQRLTTLFLLHWYFFSRTCDSDNMHILKSFSYQTRDTSKRFCEKICDAYDINYDKADSNRIFKIDFENKEKSLKDEIIEFPWMTTTLQSDPTVASMLNMLNEIDLKFNSKYDLAVWKDLLTGEECPIKFLCYPMENYKYTDKLYIKMNARGKPLSDFEIFKADLQNSDIVKLLINEEKGNDEEEVIVNYISHYNNEYAEFFYNMFGLEKYDNAMMDFIKEVVRASYFSYISYSGVSQKTYRKDYGDISKMSGQRFFSFIESYEEDFKRKYKEKYGEIDLRKAQDSLIEGVIRASRLFKVFCNNENELNIRNTYNKEYYSEESLIYNICSETSSLKEHAVRNAIYLYFLEIGFPKSDDEIIQYNEYKRIIYNILENTDLSRSENVCESFTFEEGLISDIKRKKDLFEALIDYKLPEDIKKYTDIRRQLEEEQVKIKLMTDSIKWKDAILKAEEYFVDGQIYFLLKWSKKENSSQFSLEEFEKYFDKIKVILNKDKTPKIDYKYLEKALLCMEDDSDSGTCYLVEQPRSYDSWGFIGIYYKDFLSNRIDEEKQLYVKKLLDNINISNPIEDELKRIVQSRTVFPEKQKWKEYFIENDLFGINIGKRPFQNCIGISGEKNEYIQLCTKTTTRSYSMEVNTFILYEKIKDELECRLQLDEGSVKLDEKGFPKRFIEINNKRVGFWDGKYVIYNMDNNETEIIEEEKEVIENLRK